MKKFLLTLCVIGLLFNETSVFGQENNIDSRFESYEQYLEDPEFYSDERVSERKSFNNYLERIPMSRAVTSKELMIVGYEQETKYYCGPASVKIVLKYLTNKTYSQDTLASNMGTTTSGTYVYKITNELNDKINENAYISTTIYETDLVSATKNSINNEYPVILNVQPTYLPGYNGYTSSGHYIVGYGYNGANVMYFDPFRTVNTPSSYGKHTVSFSTMETAIDANNDYYIVAK